MFALCAFAAFWPARGLARADGVVPARNAVADYCGESNFSVYLDAEKTLYASGANAVGQLGRGFRDGGKKIQPLTHRVLERVAMFDTGKSGFTLAVTEDGGVWAWGSNEFGQCGQAAVKIDPENCVTAPAQIALPDGAVPAAVAAGERHSLLLGADGGVYAWGSNSAGQLGLGLPVSRQTFADRPSKISRAYFGGQSVAAVAAAGDSSFALCETGEVYAWGDGGDGLLADGAGYGQTAAVPQRTLLSGVKKISAEGATAMALTDESRIYVWGSNTSKQFGIPEFTGNKSDAPQEVVKTVDIRGEDVAGEFTDILCGGIANFALSNGGRVFAFGAGGRGELGFDARDAERYGSSYAALPNVTAPTAVTFYKPLDIEAITAGNDAALQGKLPVDKTAVADVTVKRLVNSIGARTFVEDADGRLWSWGDNTDGMAASGDLNAASVPVRSTLYRNGDYDKEITSKNYLLQPIVGLAVIFGVAAVLIGWAEVKRGRAHGRGKM
ncbi:MAG: hypothetical protein LBL66_04145 [Clostridiales bacterium]|nr:hypothetical protein [Clostridiales bacterium]